MQLMGPVQRGLPVLSSLPQDWPIIILDIKDCFFSIPLAKEDCCRFAFTLPSINHEQPDIRYQWRVLPQGMANSPTICQLFVHQALLPTRKQYPQVRIIHYMDDILLAAPSQDVLDKTYAHIVQALEKKGLYIAPEKVQKDFIGKFVGAIISLRQIRPQKTQIRLDHLKTLNDFQKLLGDINWVRPYLSISTAELKPLFKILEGDSSITSPRTFNSEARIGLAKAEIAITNAQLNRIDDSLPLLLCVLPTKMFPIAVLWQKGPLLWIHSHASPGKTIEHYPISVASLALQGIKLALIHFATEPQLLIQPYTPKQVQILAATVDEWAVLVCSFFGVLDNHYPKDNLLLFITHHPVIFPKVTVMEPLKGAIEIYTDGSKSGIGAYLVQSQEPVQFQFQPNTPQIVECQIVYEVFKRFHEPLNLLSDSHYVVNAVRGLETSAFIKESSPVHDILWNICVLIRERKTPFFIGHIRAHTLLPGPMTAANDLVDKATRAFAAVELDSISMAKQFHQLYHVSAHTLCLKFKISRQAGRDIVKACSSCVQFLHPPHVGINPRGLLPGDLWQMDVTHTPSFGKLSYVHVSVDTCSGVIFASPLTGKKVTNVISHCLEAWAAWGKPLTMKTDNGPAYTSKSFQQFCLRMQVRHVTGLPYNPQGQGIVERENRSLKELLQKTPPSSADIPLRGQRPSSGTPEKSPRPHQYVSLLESCPSYTLGPRSTRTPSHRKVGAPYPNQRAWPLGPWIDKPRPAWRKSPCAASDLAPAPQRNHPVPIPTYLRLKAAPVTP
ncbi:hypothetical protein STEG23_020344 [Scotinomys teguina]